MRGKRSAAQSIVRTALHGEDMNSGSLIIFEGLDGSGKSTQAKRLVAALRERGCDVVETREPTDGEYGRRIRAMASSGEKVSPETELEWFFADRREHVQRLIKPALAKGQIVVSDRYFLSTVAYQGARGLDSRKILEMSEAEFPIPDLVLLLEIDVAAGLDRVTERGAKREEVFEEASFLSQVAQEFAQIERPYLVRINAARTPDAVFDDVRQTVCEKLKLAI